MLSIVYYSGVHHLGGLHVMPNSAYELGEQATTPGNRHNCKRFTDSNLLVVTKASGRRWIIFSLFLVGPCKTQLKISLIYSTCLIH